MVATVGLYSNAEIRQSVTYITSDIVPAITMLQQIKAGALQLDDLIAHYESISAPETAAASPTAGKELRKKDKLQQEIVRSLKKSAYSYFSLVKAAPGNYPSAPEIATLLHQIYETLNKPPINPGGPSEAQSDFLRQITRRLLQVVDLEIEIQLQNLKEREESSRVKVRELVVFYYSSAGLSLLLAYGVSVWLAVGIAWRVIRMTNAAAHFGRGDFQFRIEKTVNDELDQLADALNLMADRLQQSMVSKSYVDSIVSSMPNLLFVFDPNGKMKTANQAALNALALSESELGDYPFALLFPELAALIKTGRDGKLRLDEQVMNRETVVARKDSAQLKMLVSMSLLLNQDGLAEGMVVIGQDVTELKRIQEERDEYHRKLVFSEHLASLGAMSAMLAHKLNQPLTVIRLCLQQCVRALGAAPHPESVDQNLQESLVEVGKVSETVKEVLQYTRSASVETMEQVDVLEVIRKVTMVLSEDAKRARLTIDVVECEPCPRLQAGAGEVDELVFVLVQNAVQAAENRQGSQLTISASVLDGQAKLTFADTCGGIQEKHLAKLFEPFFTTKPYGKGTGLGLSIAKQIVSRLQGTITVDSQVGRGTDFCVIIPCSNE